MSFEAKSLRVLVVGIDNQANDFAVELGHSLWRTPIKVELCRRSYTLEQNFFGDKLGNKAKNLMLPVAIALGTHIGVDMGTCDIQIPILDIESDLSRLIGDREIEIFTISKTNVVDMVEKLRKIDSRIVDSEV
jgi:hypothetical protein